MSDADTFTLVSHRGGRAHASYGPTEHPVLPREDVTDLLTIALHELDYGVLISVSYVQIDGELWIASPLSAWGDLVKDGNTLWFDGELPSDEGFLLDHERFYVPDNRGLIPVLGYESHRNPRTGYNKARIAWQQIDPRTPEFLSYIVGQPGQKPDDVSLPDRRAVRSVFECDKYPRNHWDESGLFVMIHDEELSRYWFDPVEVVTRHRDSTSSPDQAGESWQDKVLDLFSRAPSKKRHVFPGPLDDLRRDFR